MKMKMLIFLMLSLLLYEGSASICFPPSILKSFFEYDEVFIGRAKLVDSTNYNYMKSSDTSSMFAVFEIEVLTKFKGSKDQFFRLTPFGCDASFPAFDENEEYLFYARYFEDSTQIRIGDCSRSTAKSNNERLMKIANIRSRFHSDLDSLYLLNPKPIEFKRSHESNVIWPIIIILIISIILVITTYNKR